MRRFSAVALGILSFASGASFAAEADPEAERLGLAVVQYPLQGGKSPAEVVAKVSAAVDRARAKGAELVMLPEYFGLDVWDEAALERAGKERVYVRQLAARTTPLILKGLKAVVADTGVAVLAGSLLEVRRGELYNTAHLLLPDGRDLTQDKVFPTAWGQKMGMSTGEDVVVHDTPWGRVAILICYDSEFPVLSQSLVKARPELILIPSMTESEHGLYRVRWAAQARAVEHFAYVAVASTVGQTSPSWQHFGRSAVITPREGDFEGLLGEAELGKAQELVVQLDFARLRRARAEAKFYPARDQAKR